MKVIYHKANIEYLDSNTPKDYPNLTDGFEYDVFEEFQYPNDDFGYMVCDDSCSIGFFNPYPSEIFETILYACPCCGRKTLTVRNRYEICETCYWEDDPTYEDSPDEPSDANKELSLNQYRDKWINEKKKGVYNKLSYERAKTYSRYNRGEIKNDNICGCYHCESIFSPQKIVEGCAETCGGDDVTALCPNCGIDSVIGGGSGYPITTEFLKAMRKYAFGD